MLNIFIITSCINTRLILILKYNLSSFFLSIHYSHMNKFHRFNKNAYQILDQKMITHDPNTSLAKCEIQEKRAQCFSENYFHFKKRSSDNLFIQIYQSRKPFFFTLLGVNKQFYKLMTTKNWCYYNQSERPLKLMKNTFHFILTLS